MDWGKAIGALLMLKHSEIQFWLHMFIPFHLTVCLAGLIAAIVVPGLPPLACKPDAYIRSGAEAGRAADKLEKNSRPCAIEQVSRKAEALKGLDTIAAGIVFDVLMLIFAVLPIAAAVATAALVEAEQGVSRSKADTL